MSRAMHNALNYEESDSSDFENEIVTLNKFVRKSKIFQHRINYCEMYDEEEFVKRFRLKKQTVEKVLNEIVDQIISH